MVTDFGALRVCGRELNWSSEDLLNELEILCWFRVTDKVLTVVVSSILERY